MKIPVVTLCLAFLVATPVLAQDNDIAARSIPDKEAKVLVSDFKKQIKASKKSLKGRLEAVQTLGRHKNNLLVRPLLTVAKSDKAKTVRQEAVKALGKQPSKRARPTLTNLLNKSSIMKEPAMTAAIVRAISNNCYDGRDWNKFQKMFNQAETNNKAADAQRAILEAAGKHKEVDAIRLLVDNIDPPEPAWVDDPSNPPASYWEARYKNWRKWNSQVASSLYQITGQRFGTAKEARVWLKKNLKKIKKSVKEEKSKKRGKKKGK